MAVNGLIQITFEPDSAATVLNDDPLNWDEIEQTVERRNAVKGLFEKYVAKLEFVGDGYDYLLTKASTDGICSDVRVKIETRKTLSDTLTELFTGLIYLRDIEIDRQKKVIKANIESEDLDKIIQDRATIKVPIGTEETLNGTSITPISYDTVQCFNPDADPQGTYSAPDVEAFKVYDMFELAITYITDNQVAFESDFFSGDNSQPEEWEFELGLPAVGTLVGISVITEHGTYSGTTTVAVGDTEESVVHKLFVACSQDFAKSPIGYEYDLLAPYYVYNTTAPFLMRSLTPVTSFTLTNGTVNSTSKTQDIGINMGGLYITNGANFWRYGKAIGPGAPRIINYSFEELFKACSDKFDLSFRLYDNAGTPTLKIERTESFFSDSATLPVTFDELKGITEEFTTDYKKFSLNISGSTNPNEEFTTLSNNAVEYQDIAFNNSMSFTSTDNCGDGTVSSNTTISPYTKDIANFWINTDNNSPAIANMFFIDTGESGGIIFAQQYPLERGWTTSFGGTVLKVITAYNGFLSNYRTARYWLWGMGSNIRMGKLQMINTSSVLLSKKVMFETPLTNAENTLLKSDLTARITIEGEGYPSTQVWIDSYKYNPRTGMAQFVCISE